MADKLNEAQRRAVEAEESILCCACPGSGKTTVVITKVRHILKTHPDPWIVMTTFSRDAADEMMDRISGKKDKGKKDAPPPLTPEQLKRITIGTFHSLAMRQLKEIGKVGKILSDIEARHLINRALHDAGSELSVDDADAIIARCKSDQAYAKDHPDHARLTKAYCKLQLASNAQDFTDLILLANKYMAQGKLKPLKATHLLSDETQDIDQMQYDWLMHHIPQGAILTAVGDDDQSIYGFRRSLGYKGMMDIVTATGADIITLDTNYRSTAGIVEAASKLIAYNADRVQKTIKAARGPGPRPRVIGLSKLDSQAMRIVQALDKICAKNEVPEPLPNREPYRFGVKPGQVAVLARTNAHLHAVETVFRNARVPFIRTGRSFWDAPVLQVYLTILESLVRQDGMGFEIALRWARITDAHIRQITEMAGGNLWNYIRPDNPVPPPATPNVELDSFIRLGKGWAVKLSGKGSEKAAVGPIHGVAGWMSRVMTKTCGEDEEGKTVQAKGRRDIRDLDRLEAARDALTEARGNLQARIRRVQENDGKEIPRVVLSTFHASKGLEWKHVFLIDVYGGSVPKVDELSSEEELAEERRVFYVAMTRAQDDLTIFTRTDMPESEFLADAELIVERISPPPETEQDHPQQEEQALL